MIAYARTNGHPGIEFPAGNFLFGSGPLGSIVIENFPDGFSIRGAGAGTTLGHRTPPTTDQYLIWVKGNVGKWSITDIQLDGNYVDAATHPGVSQQHHLLKIGDGGRFSQPVGRGRVSGFFFHGCRGDAIQVIGATSQYAILTCTGQPANGETITIGSRTYTFVTTLSGAANEILRGASLDAALTNAVSALRATAGAGTTYGTGTVIHNDLGGANRVGSTIEMFPRVSNLLALSETLAQGSWSGATPTIINGLVDDVIIESGFIFETHRSCLSVQRGTRRVIVRGVVFEPTRRGLIDFEPTGAEINSEDWAHGNSPHQWLVDDCIFIQTFRGNTNVSWYGMGTLDRNKYSHLRGSLLLGGGIDGINVGPTTIADNIIIGNRYPQSHADAMINFYRAAYDVLISNNYIERPVPYDGETVGFNTLEFTSSNAGVIYSQPAAGETFSIGVKTYTWRATLTGVANEVLIGATISASTANALAAVLDSGGAGTTYGTGTTANAAITSGTADGESVAFVGLDGTTSTETMANGYWTNGGDFNGSAGPLINLEENNGTAPARILITGNIGHQWMQSSGIYLADCSYATVSDNQLYCHHSGVDQGSGIQVQANTVLVDQVHIENNLIVVLGTGKWERAIHFTGAGSGTLGHTSAVANKIAGTSLGIRWGLAPLQIPTCALNRVSGNTGTAYVLPSPTLIAGNLGGVAIYQGAGAPATLLANVFTAPKGSTYLRTDGTIGAGGVPGTLRYLNGTGLNAGWTPLIDG